MVSDAGFAPAKINLALHVTGQREDGYHLLDTLVIFAQDVGDRLTLKPVTSDEHSLEIVGPYSLDLNAAGDKNLVLDTLENINAARESLEMCFQVTLEKNLPVSSGIGGGSADAAAAYRLADDLLRAQGVRDIPPPEAVIPGADGLMCFHSRALRASRIGDVIQFVSPPCLDLLLVNPGVPISTPSVFEALGEKDNSPLAPFPVSSERKQWLAWLKEQHNDLQTPAMELAPVIAECLYALQAIADCRLARMSGSGATCFGIFDDRESAERARSQIAHRYPDWWTAVTATV